MLPPSTLEVKICLPLGCGVAKNLRQIKSTNSNWGRVHFARWRGALSSLKEALRLCLGILFSSLAYYKGSTSTVFQNEEAACIHSVFRMNCLDWVTAIGMKVRMRPLVST